jgi:drug/metabolite transporter (DMT)-like permease
VTDERKHGGFGLADGLAISLALIWGSNYPLVKQVMTELSPMSFNGLRFVGASLFLLIALRLMGENWSVQRSDLPRLFWLGLIGIALYQVGFIYGLQRSTATNTSLIIATSPTLVVFFGGLLGMLKATRTTWLGVGMAFAGLLLVIGGKAQGLSLGSQTLAGDLLAFVSAATWAFYTLAVPPLFRHYSSLKATTIIMAIGTVPLVLISLPEWSVQDWGAVTMLGWGGLLYSTVMSIALGYVIYYYCVKRLGSTRAVVYYNLTPVFSVALAFVFLGERMTAWQAVGAAIVIAGVYLTRRDAPRAR